MKTSVIYIFSAFLLVAGCVTHKKLSTSDHERIKKEVETALHDNFEAIRNEGWIGELKVLDNSEKFSWVPPGRYAPISYDSISKILQKATENFVLVENVWIELYVKPVSKSVVTYSGRYTSRYTSKDNKITTYQMAEAGTLVLSNGKWKLISGQTFSIK